MFNQLISLSPKERLEIILLPLLQNDTATHSQLENWMQVIKAWVSGLDSPDVGECYHLYLEALAELEGEGRIRIVE
jgi:hypothetical protein